MHCMSWIRILYSNQEQKSETTNIDRPQQNKGRKKKKKRIKVKKQQHKNDRPQQKASKRATKLTKSQLPSAPKNMAWKFEDTKDPEKSEDFKYENINDGLLISLIRIYIWIIVRGQYARYEMKIVEKESSSLDSFCKYVMAFGLCE